MKNSGHCCGCCRTNHLEVWPLPRQKAARGIELQTEAIQYDEHAHEQVKKALADLMNSLTFK